MKPCHRLTQSCVIFSVPVLPAVEAHHPCWRVQSGTSSGSLPTKRLSAWFLCRAMLATAAHMLLHQLGASWDYWVVGRSSRCTVAHTPKGMCD